jgi:hypothetical protein
MFLGTVRNVENDGFWIDAPDVLPELRSLSWTNLVDHIQKPVLFVPTSSLDFLITDGDE